MKIIVYILLYFTSIFSFSQKTSVGISGIQDVFLYSSRKYEKLLVRTHLNDSVFIDKLYENYKTLITTDTFMIENSKWFYKTSGGFCHFFSDESFKKGEIIRKYYDCLETKSDPYLVKTDTYKPVETKVRDNQKIYVYKKKITSLNDELNDLCYCCQIDFDPLIGIVSFEDENCTKFNLSKLNSIPKNWIINDK